MTWAAFLAGFFAHAALVMCSRNRQSVDLDTERLVRMWAAERKASNPNLRIL